MFCSGRVVIEDRPPRPEQNILRRGREMQRGEVVLNAGAVLRPQEFGILATVGRTSVQAVPPPRVAVLPTGDEIVEASQLPGPGQIRNGNGPMLLAQVLRAGGSPWFLGIARDRIDHLRPLIRQGLEGDVLILSGGVSAGKLDLVPDVLRELGVEAKIQKVEMKPGKPLFFGVRERTLVFGLPGNPVSSFACFELFVRPALRRLRGLADPGPRLVQAELSEDFPYRTDRPTYHPAALTATERGWRVRMVPWFGSPDLLALTRANALAVLPAGDHQNRSGQHLSVICLEDS
jgi:molybdopterin molybdotransferase